MDLAPLDFSLSWGKGDNSGYLQILTNFKRNTVFKPKFLASLNNIAEYIRITCRRIFLLWRKAGHSAVGAGGKRIHSGVEPSPTLAWLQLVVFVQLYVSYSL